jgi:Fe-S cluster assembly protein SufD
VNGLPAAGTGHYLAEFERLYGRPQDLDRAGSRHRAIARFREIGFPSGRQEGWRYTNVAPLVRGSYSIVDPAATAAPDPSLLAGDIDGHRLVFVHGHYRPDLSDREPLPAGLTVRNLAAAPAGESIEVPGLEAPDSGFLALNAALAGDGAVIEVADDCVVGRPLHLLFLATAPEAASFVRTRIRVGRGSRVSVLESYQGAPGVTGFTNALTAITAAAGAAVEHVRVQEQSDLAFHVDNLTVEQAPASRVSLHSVSLGARLARHDVAVRLAGAGASVALNGLYLADGRRHIDHHLAVDHQQPDTSSRQYYKGILNDAGRGVFSGRVTVRPGAVRADADQANRNLLLSADAEADTKPELEILADDVRCSHGATVGQLDAQALFYLRSRGLSAAAARALLVRAFAADVLGRLPLPGLADRLAARVSARLPEPSAAENA